MKLFVMFYFACMVFTYGISFADIDAIGKDIPGFSDKWYYRSMAASVLVAIPGPIGLVFVLVVSNGAEHGFKWK